MRAVALLVILLGFAQSAAAEDCTAPCVGSTLTAEIKEDWLFQSSRYKLTSNTLLPEIGIESFFMPVENLKLVSNIAIEQVIDPELGANSTFDDVGAYVAELYAELTLEPVTFKAGKFDPVFSLASAVADGIHSTDLAENADMGESLSAQGTLAFEAFGLNHAFIGTAFSMDRSILAESLITDRQEPKLADGGAGNTSGVSSFQLVVDGCKGAEPGDCYEDGAYGYRLGARFQRHGRALPAEEDEDPVKPENELAFLWAANRNVEINDVTLRMLGEGAYLRNFEGSPDDALILTGSLAIVDGPLTYSTALSQQWNRIAKADDTFERLGEVALKYKPEDGGPFPGVDWSTGAGYTFAVNDADESTHTFSLRVDVELSRSQDLK